MKKLLISIAVCAVTALSATAEGYQVNSLSTRQLGMGHTGVALKLGSESMLFNPGALAFSDKTLMLSGSLTAISAHATAEIDNSTFKTDNKLSTPLGFYGAFSIYDNLYAGLAFYTPYGSSINWRRNWPGAVLNQNVDLKVYTLQPTLSWRITPKLSVGAGMTIGWGSVNLTKGLVDSKQLDQLMQLQGAANMIQNTLTGTDLPTQYPTFGNVSPASANLKGNSEVAVGINVGAMYDINEQWTVGADFRSQLNMNVKSGIVRVEYANDVAQQILQSELNNLNTTNFEASMPCPWVLTAGVSYKPVDRLTLAFDFQFNGWSAYKQLDIAFAEQSRFDQHLKKDYRNTTTWHLGAEYALTQRFDLRAGLMIDTNPCNKNYYNPETPGTTRIEPSAGFSFRPVKNLSIDFAFMYVEGLKVKNARGVYDNFLADKYNAGLDTYNATLASKPVPGLDVTVNQMLAAQGVQAPQFKSMNRECHIFGTYKIHAFMPSIGVSYSF